ncbi:peptidoglycan glycosyltransferase [Kitasatospora sp. MAP12-15]|uniref:peptidoglycan D,D-transpeptidase FtsI family protein n=1 Tax=unclassified Kitasatospora TaxID=2633591 RepID=UPI00247384ED|nr:penicillin-binding protein 2 [Kitasatospora sp. MAP12-44]MDH6111962.1 peptidoglycan glycosyltransferase [Kitasatospora sp. MAP12-44]
MNKPIRRVSVFCLLLIMALLLRTNWIQGVEADTYANNQYNDRVKYDRYAYPRGNIVAGGQPVTSSDFVNGYRYKYKTTWNDGPMYAPVTGFSSQAFGSSQLEQLEDPILSGTDDRLFFRNTLDMLTGKQKQGGDVITTINPKAQKAAFDGLGNHKGAAVAIDPRTGAILALVSTPSYDPSTFAGTSDADSQAWQALTKNPDQPMLNRALRETYPPGSTFKLVTAATAFETGKYQNITDVTDTPQTYILPGTNTPLNNDSPDEPCTNATLVDALAISCNTVYGKIGAELGEQKLLAQADKFGFNSSFSVPMKSAPSVFPNNSSPDGTAQDAIGQHNTAATPLQMAMVASAIANNGKLMQPYLVDEERSANSTTVSKHSAQEMDQAISPATAQKLQQMMVAVVQNGTGKLAQISGVEVGGKTGTAQHGQDNSGLPFAWFVSYAKVGDSAPVAVAVVVEDGGARNDISGGALAAPIAKSVMQAVIGQ